MSKSKPVYSFYFVFGILGILATLGGFTTTYIIPLSDRSIEFSTGIHIHGFFALSWAVLYTTQTSLIFARNHSLHMKLGMIAPVILTGVFITLFFAAQFSLNRDLPEMGEVAYGLQMAVLTSGIWVLGLGTAGVIYRKKPRIHRGLMFLATAVLLWPAWARLRHYFPDFPDKETVFGLYIPYFFIPVAWYFEYKKYGRVHLSFFILGALIIFEGFFPGFIFDPEIRQSFMKSFFNFFN